MIMSLKQRKRKRFNDNGNRSNVTYLALRDHQVDQNRRVSCCIQKITEMVFPKVYFFSALLAGVVGGILTMLTLKILEARPREQTRVEVDNGRETGEGCGENRSSGRTGQCGLAKEKAGMICSFNNSTFVYIP